MIDGGFLKSICFNILSNDAAMYRSAKARLFLDHQIESTEDYFCYYTENDRGLIVGLCLKILILNRYGH